MLRTNLSTRPFYNERGVHGFVVLVAALVAALTLFNVTQIALLSRRHTELNRQADAAESHARELRAHAVQTRQAVNTRELDAISSAAREANEIIEQRLFSWTDLLNRLVTTLPDNVRITGLRPRIERDGSVTLLMTVTSRSVEEVELFMANLEETTAFSRVFARQDMRTEEGLVQATVEGLYATAP